VTSRSQLTREVWFSICATSLSPRASKKTVALPAQGGIGVGHIIVHLTGARSAARTASGDCAVAGVPVTAATKLMAASTKDFLHILQTPTTILLPAVRAHGGADCPPHINATMAPPNGGGVDLPQELPTAERARVAIGFKRRADIEALLAVCIDRRGQPRGFRFKEWSDDQLSRQPISITNGTEAAETLQRRRGAGGAVHHAGAGRHGVLLGRRHGTEPRPELGAVPGEPCHRVITLGNARRAPADQVVEGELRVRRCG
jgi:hypothetical protein